jgi:hypothetical protein
MVSQRAGPGLSAASGGAGDGFEGGMVNKVHGGRAIRTQHGQSDASGPLDAALSQNSAISRT